jgi:hypothetical protein
MDTILTHAGEAPEIRSPMQEARDAGRAISRMFLAIAYVALQRLALPYRDLPRDSIPFPPF